MSRTGLERGYVERRSDNDCKPLDVVFEAPINMNGDSDFFVSGDLHFATHSHEVLADTIATWVEKHRVL